MSTGAADTAELTFEHVAVGGTFDRLHAGHRMLLAAAALVSCRSVYIGVTGMSSFLACLACAQQLQAPLYPINTLLQARRGTMSLYWQAPLCGLSAGLELGRARGTRCAVQATSCWPASSMQSCWSPTSSARRRPRPSCGPCGRGCTSLAVPSWIPRWGHCQAFQLNQADTRLGRRCRRLRRAAQQLPLPAPAPRAPGPQLEGC